jgi:DNA-directed RNA polymerase specialized sigma24 family protein
MSAEGSVTRLVGLLQRGDPAAAQQLWERYFHRLVRLARKRLRNVPRQASDEEDVALSAFESFCRNADRGRFPRLADRDGLWRLLVVFTARKASRVLRYQQRRKRGGPAGANGHGPPSDTPAEQGGKSPPTPSAAHSPSKQSIEEILSREPTPAFAAQMAEDYDALLRRLGDQRLAAIAVWRMEGYTVTEIAQRLSCAPRSVKRKLRLIRTLWEKEAPP